MTTFRARPLAAPFNPAITVLADMAHAGRLVACAGAGLSMAANANLPSGAGLGELLDQRAHERWANYLSPTDPRDLLATADAALDSAGTLQPLQHLVVGLADFLLATPNFGHRAIALLLAEGALQDVLLWNWDDCIERATPEGERIPVLRTLGDIGEVSRPSIAKVHGCATRPSTLLITTGQLDTPPIWTDAAFSNRLRNKTAVFIGVGDVADYAEKRLKEFVAEPLTPDLYVVSPTIRQSWTSTVWSDVVPLLEQSRQLEMTADDFLDQLLRAWGLWLLDNLARLTQHAEVTSFEGLLTGLRGLNSETLVAWCREVGLRPDIGVSLVKAEATSAALLAIGVLASDRAATVTLLRGGRCEIGDLVVNVVALSRPEPASIVQAETRGRAEKLVSRGQEAGSVKFVVSGTIVGPLGASDALDLIAESPDDDLIHGPSSIKIEYLLAADLLGKVA